MKSIPEIQKIVCNYFDLSMSDMLSGSQKRELIQAKQTSFFICHEYGFKNKPQLETYHNLKKGSFNYIINQVKNLRKTDSLYNSQVIEILELLKYNPKKTEIIDKLTIARLNFECGNLNKLDLDYIIELVKLLD